MINSPTPELRGYALQHLVSHLIAADRADDVYRLLNSETVAGANVWFEMREATGETLGFVSDVAQALAAVQASTPDECSNATDEPGSPEAQAILYSLILASFRGIAIQLPAGLPAALVRAGAWSESQALAYVPQRPAQNVHKLTALADVLSADARQRALATAFDFARRANAYHRSDLYIEILRHAGGIEVPGLIDEAFATLQALPVASDEPTFSGSPWLRFALQLSPWLGGAQVSDVLRKCLSIIGGDIASIDGRWDSQADLNSTDLAIRLLQNCMAMPAGSMRNDNLVAVAVYQARIGQHVGALWAVKSISSVHGRVSAISSICEFAGAEMPAEALEDLYKLADQFPLTYGDNGTPWLTAMAYLIPCLPGHLVRAAIRRALSWLEIIHDPLQRVVLLSMIVPALSRKGHRSKALLELRDLVDATRQEYNFAADDALTMLFASLGPSEIRKLAPVLMQTRDMELRVNTLARLAKHGQISATPAELLRDARSIRHPRRRAIALASIAYWMPAKATDGLSAETLRAIEQITDDQDAANTIVDTASGIADRDLETAITIAGGLRNHDSRGGGYNPRDIALSSLVGPLARSGQVQRAIEMAAELTDEDYHGWATCPRANAVVGMSAHLPHATLLVAEGVAKTVRSDYKRSVALAHVAVSYGSYGDFERAADISTTITTDGWRYWALASLLPTSVGSMRHQLNSEVRRGLLLLDDSSARLHVLTQWVRCVSGDEQLGVFEEALTTASDLERVNGRTQRYRELIAGVGTLDPLKARKLVLALMRRGALRSRGDLLCDIGVLAPLLVIASSTQVTLVVDEAIARVYRWWS